MRDHELDPDDPRLDASAGHRAYRGILLGLVLGGGAWWGIAELAARVAG